MHSRMQGVSESCDLGSKRRTLFDERAKEELFEQLEKSYISGITYSGGDPLYVGNREAITALAKEIREKFPDKTQWCTPGYEWNQIQNEAIIPYLDVVVDGRLKWNKRIRSCTGRAARIRK